MGEKRFKQFLASILQLKGRAFGKLAPSLVPVPTDLTGGGRVHAAQEAASAQGLKWGQWAGIRVARVTTTGTRAIYQVV